MRIIIIIILLIVYSLMEFIEQELGVSRSAYSLANQLKVNPDFSDVQNGKITKSVTFEAVEKVVRKIRNEWGVS